LGLTIIIVITAVVVIVVAILAAIYYSIGGIWFNLSFFPASNSLSSCSNPIVRREWRSLRDGEKRAYLASVNCLYHTPSVLWPNSTIYEDLSWTHNFQSSLSMWISFPCKRKVVMPDRLFSSSSHGCLSTLAPKLLTGVFKHITYTLRISWRSSVSHEPSLPAFLHNFPPPPPRSIPRVIFRHY
jgi:hypothetical protein